MRTATALLRDLQTAGVTVLATPDGDLELDAPRGVLTEARLMALRQYKTEIVGLLPRRCPFCGSHGMQQERIVKDGLLYVDTLCGTCCELIECFVPPQPSIARIAKAIA